jgi:hypothetical protein
VEVLRFRRGDCAVAVTEVGAKEVQSCRCAQRPLSFSSGDCAGDLLHVQKAAAELQAEMDIWLKTHAEQ